MSFLARSFGTARIRVACGDKQTLELPSVVDDRSALRCGIIADRDAAVAVLKTLIRSTADQFNSRPCALACVPTDASEQERGLVADCLSEAGTQAVYLVPEPLAAAVGAGVDISSSYAHMILDIGEGITDCAIIKEGAVVASRAVRIGCADLRDAITETILNEWGLSVGPLVAEQILQRIGAERVGGESELATVVGVDGRTGNQLVLRIPTAALRSALQPVISAITRTAGTLFLDIPHAWGSEIIDTGLLLSGGGSLLRGIRERIAGETRLTVVRAADPLGAVVRGAREMLPVAELLQLWH